MGQAENQPDRSCRNCGTALTSETTGGLCPRCLLEMNFASRTMPGGEPSPQLPTPSPEEMAVRFPQFEILECLGRGGMGIVYKARQKTLDRMVAIKVLADERHDDPQFEARFSREARTLAKLSHPNIVTVHDFGESDGMFYLVMEFVDGVNLRDVLRDGRMEPAQALAVVPSICEALQFAHDHGIVHRDIKPENILMDRDGRVKIADFGIAALVGTDAEHSGTPPYMAPEQQAADGVIDHRADIYALGVVFYEMLTGERPAQDPSRPSQRVQIDVGLDEIVLRALEKEPALRYQTAGQFRTVVETLAAEHGTPPPPVAPELASAGAEGTTRSRGMFARLWWLFPAMLILGPLVGAVAGLGVMKSTGVAQSTESAVIEVKGSQREIAATAARVTDDSTLDRISEQCQLAHAWNCKPEQVAPRLRRMIRVEPIAGTTLVRLEVDHFTRAETVPIADAIAEALVEDPEAPAISVVKKSYSVPSKVRSVFPVVLSAILGLVLSPLLALVVMVSLHRTFPAPQSRLWAAGVAGVLAMVLFVTVGFGVNLLGQIRTNVEPRIAPGPRLAESPRSPEQAALSFMKAMRDGDIDAAMRWMDRSTDTGFDPGFQPDPKTGDRLRDSLRYLSDELQQEAYAGESDRLTEFTEWTPETHDEGTRFLAVGIAAPSRWREGAPAHALYLILSFTPKGWRVVQIGTADGETSLSESMARFLQQRVLELPVTPPLTMSAGLRLPIPDSERLTAEQAERALKGVTWGTVLAAIAADGYNNQVTVRDAATHDQTWRRFEIAFRWRESMMMFDLMVDPAWTRAEPARLRNAANPDQILGKDAAAIMPDLAAEYMKRTDPILKEEISARARQPEEIKTLEQYLSALHVYRRAHDESLPPDLEPLIGLVDSYFGKSKADDSRETVGLMKNSTTGTMERPIYHGNALIRLEDLEDTPNFIMFAAPSPDAEGRRLVAFGRGIYIRAIKEADYQRQIAEQRGPSGQGGIKAHIETPELESPPEPSAGSPEKEE